MFSGSEQRPSGASGYRVPARKQSGSSVDDLKARIDQLENENDDLRNQFTIARNVMLVCPETKNYFPDDWEPDPKFGIRLIEGASRAIKAHTQRLADVYAIQQKVTELLKVWYEAGKITKQEYLEYFELVLH